MNAAAHPSHTSIPLPAKTPPPLPASHHCPDPTYPAATPIQDPMDPTYHSHTQRLPPLASTHSQPHPIPSTATPKQDPMDPMYHPPTQRLPPMDSALLQPHPMPSAATPIQDPTYHSHAQRPYTAAPQMHAVDKYAKYLRAYYQTKKLPIHSKWPPTAAKKYIHLAVVKKEEVSKEQADEFTRATLHGDIEDIVRKKVSLDFSGIGKKEDGSPAQMILVDGGPGIGKTTFAWRVCRRWSKRKILQRYRLVVLLRLRDKRVREARSIYDLLYYPDDEVRKEVAKEIIHSDGESVLLLYEGYDELPGKLQTQESIFLEILYKECLPEATVIITSRPSATQFLRDQFKKSIDQHIEILGFTKADVHSYAQSVIENQQLNTEFAQYLKCYPHIQGLMYVPLNAVIITEIYKTTKLDKSRDFVPTTLTELYTSLSRGMLLRYLKGHSKYGKQEWRLSCFADLPKELQKQFNTICKIAFEGIVDDEFIFDDLARDFNTLDLMQSVSELYVDQGSVVSHNFFHLTLQEFLAAVHVSQQPMEAQLHYFQSIPSVIEQEQERERERERRERERQGEESFIQVLQSVQRKRKEPEIELLRQQQHCSLIQELDSTTEPSTSTSEPLTPTLTQTATILQQQGSVGPVLQPARKPLELAEASQKQTTEPYPKERLQSSKQPWIPRHQLQLQETQSQPPTSTSEPPTILVPEHSTGTSELLPTLSQTATILPQQGGVGPVLQPTRRYPLKQAKTAHMQTTGPYPQQRLQSSKQPWIQRHQLQGLTGEPESTTEHSTSSSQLPMTLASCAPESELIEISTLSLPRPQVVPEQQQAEIKPLLLQEIPQLPQTPPPLTTQDQGRLEPLQVMTPRHTTESTPPQLESPGMQHTADNGRLQLETPQLEPLVPQQLLSQRDVPPMTDPQPVLPHTPPLSAPAGSLPYAVLTSNHFQNVVKFTAGLTKLKSLPLDSILLQDKRYYQEIPLYSLHWLFEAQCISKYSEMIGETTTLSFNHDPGSFTSMTPFDCFVLGFALSHINSTWKINIVASFIGDEGLEMMVAGMNYKVATLPTSLKSIRLNLRWCAISSVGLSHLKEMPEQVATRITGLNLEGNRDFSEGVASLLSNLTSLKTLDLAQTSISPQGAEQLAELLSHSQLHNGNMVSEITSALSDNSTLQILDLGYNAIGPRGATALAEMLRRNTTLLLLIVRNNSIGEEGSLKLATSLEHNKTLKTLVIDRKYVHSLPQELYLKTKNRIIFYDY